MTKETENHEKKSFYFRQENKLFTFVFFIKKNLKSNPFTIVFGIWKYQPPLYFLLKNRPLCYTPSGLNYKQISSF
jgi:hypothetical protein